GEKGDCSVLGQLTCFGSVAASDSPCHCLFVQSCAMTRGATSRASPAIQKYPQVHFVFPPLQPAKEACQTAEIPLRHTLADQSQMLGRQFTKRRIDRDVVIRSQRQ